MEKDIYKSLEGGTSNATKKNVQFTLNHKIVLGLFVGSNAPYFQVISMILLGVAFVAAGLVSMALQQNKLSLVTLIVRNATVQTPTLYIN